MPPNGPCQTSARTQSATSTHEVGVSVQHVLILAMATIRSRVGLSLMDERQRSFLSGHGYGDLLTVAVVLMVRTKPAIYECAIPHSLAW